MEAVDQHDDLSFSVDFFKSQDVPFILKEKAFNVCMLPIMAFEIETTTLTFEAAEGLSAKRGCTIQN